jgi:hypothetical protein
MNNYNLFLKKQQKNQNNKIIIGEVEGSHPVSMGEVGRGRDPPAHL